MKFERLAEHFEQLERTSSRNRMVELLAEGFRETEQFTACFGTTVDEVVTLYQKQGRRPAGEAT